MEQTNGINNKLKAKTSNVEIILELKLNLGPNFVLNNKMNHPDQLYAADKTNSKLDSGPNVSDQKLFAEINTFQGKRVDIPKKQQTIKQKLYCDWEKNRIR